MKTQDVEVLWVARYDYHENGRRSVSHEHDYYQIIYVIDGDGLFRLGKDNLPFYPGRIFFLKPYCIHHVFAVFKKPLKTYDIKFLVHDAELISLLEGVFPIIDNLNCNIPGIFKKIRAEGLERKPYYKDFGRIYLMQILLELIRINQEQSAFSSQELNEGSSAEANKICKSIIDHIKQHYQEEMTLTTIADSLGYNQSYICQVFKKNLKLTPIRFLYLYRIEKAKELMTYSDYDLKQIATITGFKTIHHFSRLFHNCQGVTPGQWRDNEKEGIRKGVFYNENFKNQDVINPHKFD